VKKDSNESFLIYAAQLLSQQLHAYNKNRCSNAANSLGDNSDDFDGLHLIGLDQAALTAAS